METVKKQKILLVDDEAGIRRILKIFLEVEGFTVLEAENAEQAYTHIEKEHPHLVVLDVILHGVTGFEVCEKIKTNPKTKDVFVILFTALSKETDITEGEKVGADLYLMKPMNPRDIVEKIKTVLQK